MRPLSDRFPEYVCLIPPEPLFGGLDDRLAESLGEARPAVLCWDSQGHTPLHLGREGPDPVLLERGGLSHNIAIRRDLLPEASQPEGRPEQFSRIVAGVLRSPTAQALWISQVACQAPAPIAHSTPSETMRTSPERVTIAVLAHQERMDLVATLAAIEKQRFASRLDVVVALSGADAAAVQTQAENVQTWAASTSIKVRRYLLAGALGPGYLANVAVALALGEVIVIVQAGCLPEDQNVLQHLADTAWGGEQATASPLIIDDDGLVAAGLAIRSCEDGDRLTLWRDMTPLNGRRLVAAPAPWMFALQRRRWISSGGALGSEGVLWTAALAAKAASSGRHLLNGELRAKWTGDPIPVDLSVPAPRTMRASSRLALRLAPPTKSAGHGNLDGGRTRLQPSSAWAFSDPSSSSPDARRLLVIADRMGPSQSIPFIDGLRGARSRGEVTVRVIEADPHDQSGDLNRQIEAFAPHVVVASRLGSRCAWDTLSASRTVGGFDLYLHLDDDLMEAPVTLGIDRYRIARNPRSMMTLARMVDRSDAILAATPVLAERLRSMGAPRVTPMPIGSAAGPPASRRQASRDQIKIVYVGSASHDPDLRMIAESLNAIIAANANVSLTLFGSIAKQPAARLLIGNVTKVPNVLGDYQAFRQRLAEMEFDIGLAPLAESHFNRGKTSTKWVEYSEAGLAVIASRAGPYAALALQGFVLGVHDGQWRTGLQRLIDSPALREHLVARSHEQLHRSYRWDIMEAGLLATLFPRPLEAAA